MNPRMQRAAMLLNQSRPQLAEQELRLALAENPDDPLGHALLARALSAQQKHQEATDEARLAVHQAPDMPYAHYCLAAVLSDRNHQAEALAAIAEAIRLDPHCADYFARQAALLVSSRRWAEALHAAEQGLESDPEHADCANLKAVALVKLGRKDLAEAAIAETLARDPENAYSHANQGWTHLEHGRPAEALEHFREALRIDPELEWARAGMVEALRARYFAYRLMLGWFLWMQKLSSGAQWGIIIGLYVAYRVLNGAAQGNPALRPFVTPLLVGYGLFAFFTWTSRPIFNLLLRLSRFGRMALSRDEIKTSNFVGALLLGMVVCLAMFLATNDWNWVWGALACGLTIPPVTAVLSCEAGWPRVVMTLVALGVFLCGAVTTTSLFFSALVGAELRPLLELLAITGMYVFMALALGSQFAAIALVNVRVRK